MAASEDLGSTRCFGAQLNGRLAKWLPPSHLQPQAIFQLELLAVLLLLQLYGPRVRGSALRIFVDNEGAKCALISGYSANSWGARIVAQVWIEAARWDIALWFERVASKDNPADGPSRQRWALARRLRWEEESEEEVDDAICIIEEVLEMNPQLCLHRGR